MPPDTSRWRLSSTYDYIDHLTAPDIGWEWLRRNEDYQRQYAALRLAAMPAETLIRSAGEWWGLCFPCRPAASRQRYGCFLAP